MEWISAMNEKEIKKLSEYCDRALDLKDARLGDEYFYQSLPQCIIDAVFSIGVRYEGTRRTVIKYCDYFNLQRIRGDKVGIPAIEKQESVESLLEKMIFLGLDKFTKEIFRNEQRTSSKSGILKTEAVFRFASTLKNYDVNYFQDVPDMVSDISFENDIRSIPGHRSGISLKYFFMLAGSDDLIKPDRHILAFIGKPLGKKATPQYAQILLVGSCKILNSKYPHLTPRLLDHMIWQYQKSDVKRPDDEKPEADHIEVEKPKDEKSTYITKIDEKKYDSKSIRVGPYRRNEIVLCSSDAGPGSQRDIACEAGYFFPGGKWVGAIRNAAERLMCRFVILTTGHGMVNPHDIITPYDMHIDDYEEQVREIMNRTIPQLIGNDRYKIVIFYAGGVPREPYIKVMKPIFHDIQLDLLTFGKPNMVDVGKIDQIVELLTKAGGTSADELKSVLKLPERFQFYVKGYLK